MTLLGPPRVQDEVSAPSAASAPRRAGLGRGVVALLVAGMVSLTLAISSLWTWRTFADSQGFADVATDMLRDPDVRQLVAEQITDVLAKQSTTARAIATARPALEQAAAAIVATDAFQGIYHAAARELHASIMQGQRSRLTLQVNDAAPLVRNNLQKLDSPIANAIQSDAIDVYVGANRSTPVDTAIRVAAMSGWLAWGFAFVAFGCLLAAVVLARDRRRAVEVLGWCLLGLGVTIEVVLHIGGGIASRSGADELQGHVLRAAFWSVTNLLSIQATIAMTAGAVLVVAAAYAGDGRLHERASNAWQEGWRRLAEPRWKALASLLLIGVAVVAMVWPAAVAAVIVRVAAFGAFVAGAVGLLDLLGSHRWVLPGGVVLNQSARRFAVSSLAVLASFAVILFFGGLRFVNGLRAPKARSTSMAVTGCNGRLELCDRRLDEVVLAGTHNAYAASTDGFYLARQDSGVMAQLASGMRAFLLDVWMGSRQEPQTIVRTDLVDDVVADAKAELSPEEYQDVEERLASIGANPPEGDRKAYLCHRLCELGYVEAETTFRRMADWLRENPNEVLVLVLEDHATPAEVIKVLERSGLADRAYPLQADAPFPTLRQMIEARRNVVILDETKGGVDTAPWYLNGYQQVLEETDYRFTAASEMSCTPNRGGDDHRLFLMNHWIDDGSPPDPAVADRVNDLDFLVERARRCQEERDQVPNIIAVDFYDHGDLLEAVDELNGIGLGNSSLQAAGAALPG